MKFTGEKYYTTKDGRLYIKQIRNGEIWGWHYWHDKQLRVCAVQPQQDGLFEITKEKFDALFFVEHL